MRILNISLGGRIVWAHKRQLKIQPNSRRNFDLNYIFRGESQQCEPVETTQQPPDVLSPHVEENQCLELNSSSRKRRREEDELSDSSSSFYGFPSDSFIYRDLHENDIASDIVNANDCLESQ